MRGLFITIEGIEGSGKTTIAKRLEGWMRERGRPTFRTREPGGTEIGETLRELILDADRPLSVQAELLLIEAARAQIMEEIIIPRLALGETVILDRHCDSTIAYQGYGRGVDMNLVEQINRFVCRDRTPDITLSLDVDVKIGLQRAQKVKERMNFNDRFESEALEFMQRVREGFLQIAERETNRVILLSAELGMEEVWDTVIREVSKRIAAAT